MGIVEPKIILISPLLSLEQHDFLLGLVGIDFKYIRMNDYRAKLSYPPAYHDRVLKKLEEWQIKLI
ncbi:hypothetical protein HYV31_02395 [candidate division WWE3 bacterium]|nr:hypothetical protein [candidate division WWE3 bacterium]